MSEQAGFPVCTTFALSLSTVIILLVRTISRKDRNGAHMMPQNGILRDYTPNMVLSIRGGHEDIVPSAWRHAGMADKVPSALVESKTISEIPCRVSSDPHEWCNDLGTVSTRDSVKLE